jgi:hypothetical protein
MEEKKKPKLKLNLLEQKKNKIDPFETRAITAIATAQSLAIGWFGLGDRGLASKQ